MCLSVCLTIVCEDALRSDHLIADMADNKTKILQCWKLAADEHLWERHEEWRAHFRTRAIRVKGIQHGFAVLWVKIAVKNDFPLSNTYSPL